jgi:hypothetical protein
VVARVTAMERLAVGFALALTVTTIWSCGGNSQKGDSEGDAAGGTSAGNASAGGTSAGTSAGSTSNGGGSISGGSSQGGGGSPGSGGSAAGGGNGGTTVDCGGPVSMCPGASTACEQPGDMCSYCYAGACSGCGSSGTNGYYEGCECIRYGDTPRWKCCSFGNSHNAGCAVGDANVDACGLPSDPGPCEGDLQRYGYNPATGECEPFTYGGCQGNDNNFETLAACELACSDYVGSGGQGGLSGS